jgi:aryl-alcohol dehydrogenase-like predicted oxidoreductase
MTSLSVRAVLLRPQIALGLLPLAIGNQRDKAAAVIAAAMDSGVRVFDAADVYARPGEPPGYTELVLAECLQPARRREGTVIATKGGLILLADGSRRPCGRPDFLRAACKASARRLSVEAIDLYQLHRVDPKVPFEDSLGTLVELADEGLIRAIGLSNVPAELMTLGQQLAGDRLVSVQNQFSPAGGLRADHQRCHELGLAFLAYGVLGGTGNAGSIGRRFPAAAAVAAARGVSVQRVIVACALARGAGMVPVIGASRAASIEDSVAATALVLSKDELTAMMPTAQA